MTAETLTIPAQTVLDKAYEQGRRTPTPIALDGGRQAIVRPRDTELQIIDPIERTEPALKRISADVQMYDLASFSEYVNRYKSDKTRVFAAPGFVTGGKPKVVADLDYHLKDTPQRRRHFATYVPRYSEQWTRWHAICAKPLKQVEFAEMIEECAKDIQEPTASTLLTIVRTFKAGKKVDFDSVVYQSNGSVVLNYSEQVQQQGQSGTLPERMKIGIPVYFRGTVYAVEVLVRYRVGGGGVTFDLKLDRPDVIENEAFGEIMDEITSKTEITPYLGDAPR